MRDITVVIPVFNRVDHLRSTLLALTMGMRLDVSHQIIVVDDGSTEDVPGVLTQFPEQIEYYRLEREGKWKNPGRAQNVGLRHAVGRFTVICHSGIVPAHGALYALYDEWRMNNAAAHLARIEENGAEVCGSQRPYFLFGGMSTYMFTEIRGYDEDFTEYGYEDDDLAFRLGSLGVNFVHHAAIVATHIPHSREYTGLEMERMRIIHYNKMEAMRRGDIGAVRNLDRDWGAL